MTWGGAADECVKDILSNPRAALLVIRNEPQQEEPQPITINQTIIDIFSKTNRCLKDKGYVGYCYIRHGLSGTIYVDNVETNQITPALSKGLVLWIRATMAELGSPMAFVGKAYSDDILNGQGLESCQIKKKTLMDDMPSGSGKYADICKEEGVWEIRP